MYVVVTCLLPYVGINTLSRLRVVSKDFMDGVDSESVIHEICRILEFEPHSTFTDLAAKYIESFPVVFYAPLLNCNFDDKWRKDKCQYYITTSMLVHDVTDSYVSNLFRFNCDGEYPVCSHCISRYGGKELNRRFRYHTAVHIRKECEVQRKHFVRDIKLRRLPKYDF